MLKESTPPVAADGGIMERLKASTADLHHLAESRELQRSMAKGSLPREPFAAYLAQLFLVHQTLEARLRKSRSTHPAFALVNHEYQQREHDLLSDLAAFQVDTASIKPLPATQQAIQQIDRFFNSDAVGLLGMLYVLEGSNNGSKYIARSVSRAYGLKPGEPGLRYLDPYGDQQSERWQAFKRDMSAAIFSEKEMHTIIDAAKAMFTVIAEISDELMRVVRT